MINMSEVTSVPPQAWRYITAEAEKRVRVAFEAFLSKVHFTALRTPDSYIYHPFDHEDKRVWLQTLERLEPLVQKSLYCLKLFKHDGIETTDPQSARENLQACRLFFQSVGGETAAQAEDSDQARDFIYHMMNLKSCAE